MVERDNQHPVPTAMPEAQPPGLPPSSGAPRLPGDEPEGTDWRRILAATLRYKWLVLVCVVGGSAGGVLATRFAAPTYETEATIWIESGGQGRDADDRGPIRPEELLQEQGWVDLLRSYAVLDDAVESLRLYLRPAVPDDSVLFRGFDLREQFAVGEHELRVSRDGARWALMTEDGRVVETGVPGDSIGGTLGYRWAPPPERLPSGRAVAFTVMHPREVSRSLADRLRATTERNGSFLEVSLQGSNPVGISTTLNAVVTRFVDVAADLKREKLTELVRILDAQLEEAGRNLRQAETEYEDFQVRTITLPSERATPVAPGLEVTQDPVFENFFSMQIEIDQIGRDREAIERVLREMPDSGIPTGALEVIDAVRGSSDLVQAMQELTEKRADLRALLSRYTAAHPPVQQVQEEIAQLEQVEIPRLARALVRELASREASLRERLASASRELRQIPARQVQEARLSRRVTIAENLYTMLQQRYEEARLAEASSIPDVRVLSSAITPQVPVSDRARQLMLIGILGGFGLALGLVVLIDRFDRRVRYPDQVTHQLGLPILGVLPHLKGSRNGRDGKHAVPVIEAVRGVRLNVVHAHGTAGPLLVTVTSPGSGDGKSFVASNLALAFADAGHRTLLIDGDTRRGRLHRVLAVSRKPGLTDVLLGGAHRDDAVQRTEYERLFFVGGGTRRGGAPELLGSPAMSQFLTGLRSAYSVIIVDSPPLGAGVDAYALATATNSLLFVMRTGFTDREHAEATLEVLDRLPVRVLGAVLNDVREGRAYGYSYYSYYMPGYELEDETTDRPKQLLGARKAD